MSNAMYEELDQAVTAFMANPEEDVASYVSTEEVRELLEVVGQLEHVARPGFKTQLRQDLFDEMFVSDSAGDVASYVSTHNGNGNGANGHAATSWHKDHKVLPSLFGLEEAHSMQRRNFAASVALHTLALGALVASSTWIVQRGVTLKLRDTTVLSERSIYPVEPAFEKENSGGGAGGDADRLTASQGQPPKFALEQFTPPAVVIRNPQPELVVPPTVLGQQQNLPQLSRLGDPLSRVVPPSNGTGSGGGMGSDTATGIGGGKGPGVGWGSGGNFGGGVFRIGGAVRAPRAIYSPDPEYSEEARRVKHQGTVILWGIIGADGLPRDLRVARALGMGLDQKALEAVRHWRFEPAMKDGQPVAVQVNIEVNFRLY